MAPVYPDINHLYSLYRAHPRVTTDTRHMEPGGIFFALSGPNFDGNAFAGQAIARGAVAAVVSDPGLTGSAFIHVEDPLSALQALARYHRAQLDIPVIGITGSNGKTTTKELLHRVLSGRYHTFATQGNLNNHIGVPLSLLAIDDTVELAVIEMGANHVGEIRSLCSMARPTHGVITNIGQAHLEGFGGIEGIKRGKAELFDALAANGGVAFVHAGQPHLDDLSQRVARRVLYRFGDVPHCAQDSVVLVREKGAEQIALQVCNATGEVVRITSDLFGDYNADNIATAVAIGLYFEVPLTAIRDQVAGYVPGNNRSQRVKAGGHRWVMDAYNANPTSMHLALDSFAAMPGDKSLILGEMRELGTETGTAHAAVAARVAGESWQEVLLVGKAFEIPAEEQGLRWFADVDALIAFFKRSPLPPQTWLVKGSRSVRLERVLEAFS